jgi:hypothetical protein
MNYTNGPSTPHPPTPILRNTYEPVFTVATSLSHSEPHNYCGHKKTHTQSLRQGHLHVYKKQTGWLKKAGF